MADLASGAAVSPSPSQDEPSRPPPERRRQEKPGSFATSRAFEVLRARLDALDSIDIASSDVGDSSSHGDGERISAALAARVAALEAIARWICNGPKPPKCADDGQPHPATARLEMLVAALAQSERWRTRLAAILRTVMAECATDRLLCEVGIPNDRGILEETADRLARRLLPTVPDAADLSELLCRAFRSDKDAAWIASLDPALTLTLDAQLGSPFAAFMNATGDAITVLTTRVSALALTAEIRARSGTRLSASPFLSMPAAKPDALPPLVADARATLVRVRDNLERFGVSVDVVYRMDVIAKGLDRIEALVALETAAHAEEKAGAAIALVASLTRARARDRSLRDLLRDNLSLLSRKLVERAGKTGEHYITTTGREYRHMILSAAGGGILTAGTCVVKYLVKWGHFPLFADGMLSAMNYAGSFILMQLLGMTLATKQPSMTAPALANAIRGAPEEKTRPPIAVLTARICRSQLAAVLGNLGAVVPTVLLFDLLYRRVTGHPFLNAETAHKTLASLDPTTSGTIPFAALTGVLLWLSSLAAGWLENWAVYRRLPEAIEDHWLGRVSGRPGRVVLRAIARWLSRNLAGFGGNFSLGLFLGMTPVIGLFFGLPIDVRHVTLSTGSLALAASALGGAMPIAQLRAALSGIAIIGGLNFGVSFLLALALARRARGNAAGSEGSKQWTLLKSIARYFLRSPREFFVPPRGGASANSTALHEPPRHASS